MNDAFSLQRFGNDGRGELYVVIEKSTKRTLTKPAPLAEAEHWADLALWPAPQLPFLVCDSDISPEDVARWTEEFRRAGPGAYVVLDGPEDVKAAGIAAHIAYDNVTREREGNA